jgi:3-oxoadipate enol-lactonase
VIAIQPGRLEHNDESIYFEVSGDGDPLVFCHGLGGNHASWFQQVRPFSERYRMVTWDQRGFGNSTRRTGAVGPEPAAGDLAALLDHLGIDRAHVVGQSMGGWVTMQFALSHRDRVRSMVLTDTLAGVYDDDIQQAAQASFPMALARPEGLDVWHPALGPKTCAERPDVAMLYLAITSFGDKPNDGEVLAMLANTRHDLDAVHALGIPTLGIAGHDDLLCPPAAVERVAKHLGGEFRLIERCGHSPYFEAPEVWNAIVLEWLSGAR